MIRKRIDTARLAAATAVAAVLAAGPALADNRPNLPPSVTTSGDYMVALGSIQSQQYQQGQYSNGTYSFFGSGPTPLPVNGADGLTLSLGRPGSSITLQPTLSPFSVKVAADASLPQDPNFPGFDIVARGSLTLTYLVDVRANSKAAADLFKSVMAGGGVAHIAGQYEMDETGTGWGYVRATTGVDQLDYSQHGQFFAACSLIGYAGSPDACNQSRTYSAPLNFVFGADYANAGAFDFISQIQLSVGANAGPPGLGYLPGTFTSYLDPTILFNSALDPNDYTLSVGGVDTAFVTAPSGAPEPGAWALLLAGFAGAGAALRGRARRAAAA